MEITSCDCEQKFAGIKSIQRAAWVANEREGFSASWQNGGLKTDKIQPATSKSVTADMTVKHIRVVLKMN